MLSDDDTSQAAQRDAVFPSLCFCSRASAVMISVSLPRVCTPWGSRFARQLTSKETFPGLLRPATRPAPGPRARRSPPARNGHHRRNNPGARDGGALQVQLTPVLTHLARLFYATEDRPPEDAYSLSDRPSVSLKTFSPEQIHPARLSIP